MTHWQAWLKSTTARLAATYLALIMVLSVAFSLALYKIDVQEIERQRPPQSFYTDQFGGNAPDAFDNFFSNRIAEGRHALIARLILLNLLTLLIGAAISYYLARRTLEPIE